MCCGERHTLALLNDGTVVACGFNMHHQCGVAGGHTEVSCPAVAVVATAVEVLLFLCVCVCVCASFCVRACACAAIERGCSSCT